MHCSLVLRSFKQDGPARPYAVGWNLVSNICFSLYYILESHLGWEQNCAMARTNPLAASESEDVEIKVCIPAQSTYININHYVPNFINVCFRQNYDYINISDAMIEDFGGLAELDLTDSIFICNEGVEKFVLMASEKSDLEIKGYVEGWGYSCKTSNNEVKSFASYVVSYTLLLGSLIIEGA